MIEILIFFALDILATLVDILRPQIDIVPVFQTSLRGLPADFRRTALKRRSKRVFHCTPCVF